MTDHRTTAGRLVTAAAAAALVLTTTHHAAAAPAAVKASVRKGVLTVTGTANADAISVRLRQGDPSVLEVDLGADGTADYAFDRTTFTSVTVSGAGGADRLVADSSNGAFTDTEVTTLDGGDGGDVLTGTVASERLVGGAGDDLLTGGVGPDVVTAGDGADVVTWEPGGGSDTVDAGAGADRLLFQASNASEAVGLSATAAGHVRLTRDIASVSLDLAGVESVDLRLLGGTDTVSASDLTGTGVATVTTDLDGPTGDDASADEITLPTGVVVGRDGAASVVDGLGARFVAVNGGAGDGLHVVGTAAPDEQVTVRGTGTADAVTAAGGGSEVVVEGATPGLQLRLSAADRLAVLLGAGDDSYATRGSVSGLVALAVDGGDGADQLSGGTGAETLGGGAGDDLLAWAPGGGNDVLDGGTGADRLTMYCANVSEKLDVSAEPDGHVRLARDIGSVVLDVAGIETADLRLIGGTDHVLVDDLTGTGLTTVDADLSDASAVPDGQADEVVLFGTPGDDTVTVAAENGAVTARGLQPAVSISGADPALDRLTVYGMRGTDTVTASPDAAALIQLALFP